MIVTCCFLQNPRTRSIKTNMKETIVIRLNNNTQVGYIPFLKKFYNIHSITGLINNNVYCLNTEFKVNIPDKFIKNIFVNNGSIKNIVFATLSNLEKELFYIRIKDSYDKKFKTMKIDL